MRLDLLLIMLAIGTEVRASDKGAEYRSVVYFVNWGIYVRNWTPLDLPAINLTHVFYAFAGINPVSGQVSLTDEWADTGKRFPGDSVSDAGDNLYGALKQLYLLKKQTRTLKSLLSIGGWTFRANFASPASTVSGREMFAQSAVKVMTDMGFDGLDIDWEYPQNDNEAQNLVLLLQTVRKFLDTYGDSLEHPYRFQLTVTAPAGPVNYKRLNLAEMDQYVDFWNLMAFDYAGASWSDKTANQANLFSSRSFPASTPFDTATAVEYYTSHGVASGKLVLGMPLYGRSFMGTDGLGEQFNPNARDPGSWGESGVYDYKDLPLKGATEHYDNTTGSSWSYDSAGKNLISYDIPEVALQKALWIRNMRLGGAMWWESSGDGKGDRSLISKVVGIIGGKEGSTLESSENCLNYPNSTWKNLRAGMPEDDVVLPSTVSVPQRTSLSASTDLTATSHASTNSPTSSCLRVHRAPSTPYIAPNNATFNLRCGRYINSHKSHLCDKIHALDFRSCLITCSTYNSVHGRCIAFTYSKFTEECKLYTYFEGLVENDTADSAFLVTFSPSISNSAPELSSPTLISTNTLVTTSPSTSTSSRSFLGPPFAFSNCSSANSSSTNSSSVRSVFTTQTFSPITVWYNEPVGPEESTTFLPDGQSKTIDSFIYWLDTNTKFRSTSITSTSVASATMESEVFITKTIGTNTAAFVVGGSSQTIDGGIYWIDTNTNYFYGKGEMTTTTCSWAVISSLPTCL